MVEVPVPRVGREEGQIASVNSKTAYQFEIYQEFREV